MTQQRLKTQVLVIGAGISGSTSALTLADAGYEVTLIVPGKELDGGNSALAQGGIVYRSDPNDAKDLEKDILIAGHHHNYVKAVRHLCQHGPEAVERILMERAPIPFDRLDGKLDFTREGGHGKHRIVHCADHTGKTIMEGLLQAVRMSPNIRILTGRTAVDLITTDHHARYKEYRYQLDNQCLGAYVYNEDTREVETLLADFTVLATGGVGQVYLHTTNTAACTGSGIAMAQRAGVRLDNLEYVQFHPTALYTRQSHSFLITEAMRGEGARLTNAKGEFFMKRYDERADLAPRDIVARAIMDEMLHSGEPCMYLDVSGVKHDIPTRFPTIYQHCMELGIDINFNLELQTDPLLDTAADRLIEAIATDDKLRKWIVRFAEEQIDRNGKWDVRSEIVALGRELFREQYKTLQSEPVTPEKLTAVVGEAIARSRAVKDEMRRTASEARAVIADAGLRPEDFAYGRQGCTGYLTRINNGEIVPYGKRVQDALGSDDKWVSAKSPHRAKILSLVPQLRGLFGRLCETFDRNFVF